MVPDLDEVLLLVHKSGFAGLLGVGILPGVDPAEPVVLLLPQVAKHLNAEALRSVPDRFDASQA